MRPIAAAFWITVGLFAPAGAARAEIRWPAVDAALGRNAMLFGPVHKYGFPRTDLHVTLDGVAIEPGLALGGWVAFEPMGRREAAMMGDLVLTEGEVGPVMRALLGGGVQVTGIHNHLLRARPSTFYMHVTADGDPEKLAGVVRDALAQSKTPLEAPPPPSAMEPPKPDFDAEKVEQILGFPGKKAGAIYQFGIPRAESVKADGMTLTPAMGTATTINFQPTGDGNAAVSGDFVALAREVEPLLKALQANRIEVTALHNHMLDDEPRLFFVHFWAHDDAARLAKGLRAGLDVLHLAPRS